jgi:serine/threonine-protein kinase
MMRDLAGAVQAMHDRGVLHRDLKSANVLFHQPAPGEVVPRLADFGLVRLIDGAEELTGANVVVGTPGAMSPEQAEGRRRLGPAADVWGLGVILYEMLTGRPPFDAESTTELLGRAASDSPEPPSRLVVGVPPDLEHICLACLRKDPRDRYQSAAALADDLSAFLAGNPLPSRPSTWEGRLWSFTRRHGAALVSLAAPLWLLAVLFAWYGTASSLGRSERELHHLRLDLARDRLERGDRAGAWMVLERCPQRRRDAEWDHLWARCQPPGE